MYEEDVLFFVEVGGRIYVPEEFYANWELVENAVEDLSCSQGKPVERVSSGRLSFLSDALAVL